MRSLLAILLIFGFYACQPAENTATADSQTESEIKSGNAYTLTSVPGTDLVQATKYNEAQQVVETGFFLNNLPEGTWKFYNPAKPEFPNKVISYHQGIKQGLYLELSERGDVTLKAN
ncbi:MAG: hypothetical protein KDD15_33970, partial [Lewinella sp.]|nr:hypothetical protein [Lewinella sp.]